MKDSSLALEKTVAIASRRYNTRNKLKRKHVQVLPEQILQTQLSNIPDDWKKFIHPEGCIYFYNSQKKLITEANIQSPDIAELIDRFFVIFQDLVKQLAIALSESTDIVFELDEVKGKCGYYLTDEVNRRQFWLDEANTASLGMDTSFDQFHLNIQLEEHFWTHKEFFPMHRPLPENAQEDLIGLLSHAAADQMTSEESTSPYTATECERFIQLIKGFQRDCGAKRCIIARLHRVLAHSQFINNYGQTGARLSRTQSILDEEAIADPFIIQLLARALLFNTPEAYMNSLKYLWVDRVVYAEHWKALMLELNQSWTQSIILSATFMTPQILVLTLAFEPKPAVEFLMAVSSTLALLGIASGIALLHRHRGLAHANAVLAGNYLENSYHSNFGFHLLSIQYALPYSATLWAFGTFVIALLCFLSQTVNPPYSFWLKAFIAGFVAIFVWVTFNSKAGTKIRQQ